MDPDSRGRLQGEHPNATIQAQLQLLSRGQRISLLLVFSLGLLGSVTAIVIAIIRWNFAFTHFGPAVVWHWASPALMTSLGLFLIAVFALMIWAVRQREFAFVHGGGLTLQRGRSRHDYSWEHLGDLKLSVIRYGLSWWVWGQRAHASITTDQGKHLHFRASMADMDPFAHAIKHYLYPLRLNEYRQRLKSKQTLQLGPIRCSPEGLVYRRKTYSWDSVESVHLDAGQLIIKTRQVDKMRTIRIATGRIPNPDLCAQFLGSIEY